MKKLTFISLLGPLIFSLGCSELRSRNAFTQLQEVDRGEKSIEELKKPYCQMDYADYELDARVYAFEIFDKRKIGFGFNLLSGIFRAFGLSMETERGEMKMNMWLFETLKPSMVVSGADGRGKFKGKDFRANLNLVRLGVDYGYFKQTPLHRLTEKTVKDALNNIRDDIDYNRIDWSTKVVRLPEKDQIIIPSGGVAGLRVGDQLEIYNMEYEWEGLPCTSELLMGRPTTRDPIVVAEIIHIETNASLLEVVSRNHDIPVELGSMVKAHHLPLERKEKERHLRSSVRVRNVLSEDLIVEGGGSVSIKMFIENQIPALLSEYGLYERM